MKTEKWKALNFSSILKKVDTFVKIAITSTSVTSSITSLGYLVILVSFETAGGLEKTSKIKTEIITNKDIKYKKPYESAQQTFHSFGKLYRKSLKDDIIDEKDWAFL